MLGQALPRSEALNLWLAAARLVEAAQGRYSFTSNVGRGGRGCGISLRRAGGTQNGGVGLCSYQALPGSTHMASLEHFPGGRGWGESKIELSDRAWYGLSCMYWRRLWPRLALVDVWSSYCRRKLKLGDGLDAEDIPRAVLVMDSPLIPTCVP